MATIWGPNIVTGGLVNLKVNHPAIIDGEERKVGDSLKYEFKVWDRYDEVINGTL